MKYDDRLLALLRTNYDWWYVPDLATILHSRRWRVGRLYPALARLVERGAVEREGEANVNYDADGNRLPRRWQYRATGSRPTSEAQAAHPSPLFANEHHLR